MKKEKLLALGHKIRLERIKRQMSQEEFAEKVGISRRAISCIECGVNDPKYTSLLGISEALGVEIYELLNFKL